MQKILLASLVSAAFAMPTVAAEQADVVIIGSGGAGLSAAVTAHDLGKKVIVLEKMAMVGGNTNRAAGGLNAAETKPQAKLGIKDSIESHFNDTIKGGHYLNNPDLDHKLTDNAKYSVDFINDLGGDLNDVGMMAGASQKRAHRPTGGGFVGAEVVRTLYKASKDRNIDIRTMADAQKLIVKDGKVVGVQFKQGKKPAQIVHAKAVVIASGGFSANQAMVAKIDPKLKGFATTNQPGATGDDFINELQTRDVVSAAELKQTDKVGYLFFDNSVRKSLKAIETYIKKGLVTEGKTPEELAQKLGINADNLKATLADYAKFQADKKDAQFGRADMPRPLTEAPYYAVMVNPAVHHTMGGLRINTEAQVLNHQGNVIPGLFAAGEVTGGVHGGNRLGGNAMADIVTFGRIAGRNAAENPTGVIIPRATPPQTAEKLAHEAK